MFKLDEFRRSEFTPRTSEVELPSLKDFFDGPPVWKVRGLNSSELHLAMDAARRQASLDTIVKAISNTGEVAAGVRKMLGMSGDTPGEIAKRLEMMVMGSLVPKVELGDAVKFAEAFPVEFLTITNEITMLTGKGYDMVKPAAASETIPDSSPV